MFICCTDRTNDTLNIRKHCSGTAVGWNLHPQKLAWQSTGSQMLQYMPAFILILFLPVKFQQFSGCTELSSSWGPGVHAIK